MDPMQLTLDLVQTACLAFIVVRLYSLDMDVAGLRPKLTELLELVRQQGLKNRLDRAIRTRP